MRFYAPRRHFLYVTLHSVKWEEQTSHALIFEGVAVLKLAAIPSIYCMSALSCPRLSLLCILADISISVVFLSKDVNFIANLIMICEAYRLQRYVQSYPRKLFFKFLTLLWECRK